MSRCNFDLLPIDFEGSWYIKRHVITVCTKSEWNRAIPGWIMDNFTNVCTCYISHCDFGLSPFDFELL